MPANERRSAAVLAHGLALGLLVITASAGCSTPEPTRPDEMPPAHVRVATVVQVAPQAESRHLVLLTAARRARLAPRLGGQVVALDVDEQQEVKEGQVLAKLAADDPKGALMAAQATIARIKESMHDNARELATAEKLVAQGAETSRAVERLQTDGATLEAQLREAKGQLVRAKDAVGATTIEAPFDGTITRIDTELGEYVGPQSIAMELAQLHPLAAEVPLSEAEVRLHDEGGLTFELHVRGEVRPARLEWLAREAEPGTSTFTARLLLDNPDARLRAGESAEVHVRGPHAAPAKAVPMTAVRWASDRAFVLVLVGDTVQRVPVRVLEDAGELVAIEGELQVGDRVVATGPTALMPGETVVAVEGTEPAVARR